LPRYARGATPKMRAPSAGVFGLPAAIPATCVPWDECSGSKGFEACFHCGRAGGNARATITFAVAYAVWPFG
jgi:hypothetical protein